MRRVEGEAGSRLEDKKAGEKTDWRRKETEANCRSCKKNKSRCREKVEAEAESKEKK